MYRDYLTPPTSVDNGEWDFFIDHDPSYNVECNREYKRPYIRYDSEIIFTSVLNEYNKYNTYLRDFPCAIILLFILFSSFGVMRCLYNL
jgi:hypothetical protein